jgi:HEAT repeat protein
MFRCALAFIFNLLTNLAKYVRWNAVRNILGIEGEQPYLPLLGTQKVNDPDPTTLSATR